MKIGRIKLADIGEAGCVCKLDPAIVPLDESVTLQLPEHPVGMDRGQAKRIGEDGLR